MKVLVHPIDHVEAADPSFGDVSIRKDSVERQPESNDLEHGEEVASSSPYGVESLQAICQCGRKDLQDCRSEKADHQPTACRL